MVSESLALNPLLRILILGKHGVPAAEAQAAVKQRLDAAAPTGVSADDWKHAQRVRRGRSGTGICVNQLERATQRAAIVRRELNG